MSYQETRLVDALKLTDYLDAPMEAYYLGGKEVTTRFGEQKIHNFQKADGKKLSFWGFTAWDRLLEQTPTGIMVKSTYTGKSETANKYGNKSHCCTVFFNEDDKLEGYEQAAPEAEDNSDLPF